MNQVLQTVRVALLRKPCCAFKNTELDHNLNPLSLVLLLEQLQVLKKVLNKDEKVVLIGYVLLRQVLQDKRVLQDKEVKEAHHEHLIVILPRFLLVLQIVVRTFIVRVDIEKSRDTELIFLVAHPVVFRVAGALGASRKFQNFIAKLIRVLNGAPGSLRGSPAFPKKVKLLEQTVHQAGQDQLGAGGFN